MKTTICGSYRKFSSELTRVYKEFISRGIEVLSPPSSQIVGYDNGFVSMKGDLIERLGKYAPEVSLRMKKMVEDAHLEAITRSDFVWLIATNGYIGNSAGMEIGRANAHKVPVFVKSKDYKEINDDTIKNYVHPVRSIDEIILSNNAMEDYDFIGEKEKTSEVPNARVCPGAIVLSGGNLDICESKVLLMRDPNDWEQFTLIGGKTNFGEDLERGLKRILYERTGLRGIPSRIVSAKNSISLGKYSEKGPTIFLDFMVNAKGIPTKGRGVEELRWFPLPEALDPTRVEPNTISTIQGVFGIAA